MNNIGYLLMKVSKDLRYALTKQLTQYGLTTSQWAVLKRLELEEDRDTSLTKRTAVEIAAKLELDKPTISGIIQRLTEKEMIRKEQHPTDRRASVLFLTEKARKLIPTLNNVSDFVISESLKNFTTEEKNLFLLLLIKMDSTLSRGEES
jgi:DNA-binding MarR family transcriptional regulator